MWPQRKEPQGSGLSKGHACVCVEPPGVRAARLGIPERGNTLFEQPHPGNSYNSRKLQWKLQWFLMLDCISV
ncbi:UNVERIFIED_CONTAM: hypothetical protein FKN15_002754 [Acipenser sinensis]